MALLGILGMFDIPDDCLYEILKNVSPKSLFRLSQTCRTIRTIIYDYKMIGNPPRNQKEFEEACRTGKYAEILLAKRASWEWDFGLAKACRSGQMDIIELVIFKGASCWTRGFKNACRCGHKQAMDLMLEKFTNEWKHVPNVHASIYKAGIIGACRGGHVDIAKEIIEKYQEASGFPLIIICGTWSENIIRSACRSGSLDMFNFVQTLPVGTRMSPLGNQRLWGIENACIGGNRDIINSVLEMAMPKESTKNFFIFFCISNDIDRIDEFLKNNKLDEELLSVGFQHLCHSKNIQALKHLIKKGYVGKCWDDGICRACQMGNMEIIRLLMESGTEFSESAFLSACQFGYRDGIDLYISLVDITGREGRECREKSQWIHGVYNRGLKAASFGGQMDIVEKLVQLGADSWFGSMNSACEGGYMDIVLYMYEKLNHNVDDWTTLLTSASGGRHGNRDVIDFIIDSIPISMLGALDLAIGIYGTRSQKYIKEKILYRQNRMDIKNEKSG